MFFSYGMLNAGKIIRTDTSSNSFWWSHRKEYLISSLNIEKWACRKWSRTPMVQRLLLVTRTTTETYWFTFDLGTVHTTRVDGLCWRLVNVTGRVDGRENCQHIPTEQPSNWRAMLATTFSNTRVQTYLLYCAAELPLYVCRGLPSPSSGGNYSSGQAADRRANGRIDFRLEFEQQTSTIAVQLTGARPTTSNCIWRGRFSGACRATDSVTPVVRTSVR